MPRQHVILNFAPEFHLSDIKMIELGACVNLPKPGICSPILHKGSFHVSMSAIRITVGVFHSFYPCGRYSRFNGITDRSKFVPSVKVPTCLDKKCISRVGG